jgi:hypothetical protein
VSNLVDDPAAVEQMRQRGEREIYLYFERPSRWKFAGSIARSQLEKLTLVMASAILTGVFWLPLQFLNIHTLEASDTVLLAMCLGFVASFGIMWYSDKRRSKKRASSLAKEALRVAGSRANDLHLYDGTVSDFVPAGVIATTHGRIALGIDPEHQLMRHVSFSEDSNAIAVDWILGLDTFREIDVTQEPVQDLTARFLTLFGRPLPLRWVLHMSETGEKAYPIKIDDKSVLTAKELVRQLKRHRNKADDGKA